jgi:coenzyme Q-binding protein COQ10
MPATSIKKIISCSKENLIKMVLDIEKYPEFVPWCIDGKIHTINKKNHVVEITADLTIGKSLFTETYKSFIIHNKSSDTIWVKNINGPLKHLENKWFFKQLKKNTEIEFSINFELKNKVLNLLMIKSFDIGVKKIVDAFENRANELFNRV